MTEVIEEGRQFGAIEEGDDDLCRALWISVIVQALIDAKGKSSKSGNRRDRQVAKKWLAAESEYSDFARICDLAGLPFHETRQKLGDFLKSDYETLDFRCLTKAWGKSETMESRSRFFRRARRNADNRRKTILELSQHAKTKPASRSDACSQRAYPPGPRSGAYDPASIATISSRNREG